MTKLKKVAIIKWGKEYSKVFESLDVEALFEELPELRTYLAELDRLNVAARALSQYKGLEKIVLSLVQSTNVVYCWLGEVVYDRSELLAIFAARAVKLLEEITAERKLTAMQHRILVRNLLAQLFEEDFLVLNGIFIGVEVIQWSPILNDTRDQQAWIHAFYLARREYSRTLDVIWLFRATSAKQVMEDYDVI